MSRPPLFTHSVQREWQWLKYSRWDLAMVWWLPLASALFVWWLFAPQQPHKLPIGVWDQDHSSISRQITRFLDASPGLSVAAQFSDAGAAEAALRQGHIYAVVYLPQHLAKTLKTGRHADVVLNVNAQFGTHSGLIQRDVMTVVATVSAGIQIKARSAHGQAVQQAMASFTPIKANTTALFNVATDYQQFLGSMLMPALLHIFAMTAGAYTVGRELRDFGMTQWLHPQGTVNAPRACGYMMALLGKL
ncbi:MAG: ABC transporter permease, partial [Neisseriaceae bacterium]|nr:ABC transporter permease [Neisseriaceae bacterium]